MNNYQVAPCSSFKRRREHIHVTLVTDLTAKVGGNADIAGANICPVVNTLESQTEYTLYFNQPVVYSWQDEFFPMKPYAVCLVIFLVIALFSGIIDMYGAS